MNQGNKLCRRIHHLRNEVIQRKSLKKRVRFFLASDGRRRSMTRHYQGFLGEHQQSVMDRTHELPAIPARQVGPPDRASEQCVARNQQLLLRNIQANGALGVSGRLEDLPAMAPASAVVPTRGGFTFARMALRTRGSAPSVHG